MAGAVAGPFAAFKDSVELAVVLAVLYALYRRLVLHPPRLERNREALLVLGLILTIMLTDIAFDGLRFTQLAAHDDGVALERSHAYSGRSVAAALGGIDAGALSWA